ncbi:hypothetical protein BU23DRAFT_562405, partial [Bimuria novae-zelandiae CBS 107.79]
MESHWSFDRTTAVSPKHAEPLHRRFASNARLNPHAEAQALISRPAALYLSLYPSHHIVFPFNEPRLALAAAWSRNRRAEGLEKHGDVVGLVRSFVRSAERTTAGVGARGRRNGYRCVEAGFNAGSASA